MEAKGDSKKKSKPLLFFHKKGPYSPNRANKKNPVNPVHSPLRPWMFRSDEQQKIKPQSKVKFVVFGLKNPKLILVVYFEIDLIG